MRASERACGASNTDRSVRRAIRPQTFVGAQIEADSLERQRLEAKMEAHERYLDKLRESKR